MTPGAIYVGLDGTLAHYDKWKGPTEIGEPVREMALRVEKWLDRGIPVKIFTARVWTDGSPERNAEAQVAHDAVCLWLRRHFGVELPVTCVMGFDMIALYDDRAYRVEKNTGLIVMGDELL